VALCLWLMRSERLIVNPSGVNNLSHLKRRCKPPLEEGIKKRCCKPPEEEGIKKRRLNC